MFPKKVTYLGLQAMADGNTESLHAIYIDQEYTFGRSNDWAGVAGM